MAFRPGIPIRFWGFAFSICLLLASSPASAISVTPSPSPNGNYTVSWSVGTGCVYDEPWPGWVTFQCWILQEKTGSGSWVSLSTPNGATSWNATGKSANTYSYQILYSYGDIGGGSSYVLDGPVSVVVQGPASNPPPISFGFDERFKAFSGDLNDDGSTDLLLSRPADIVMLPGEVVIPIVVSPAHRLVLLQNPDRTFSVHDTLSSSELEDLRTWTSSPVELRFRDINTDGKVDVVIRDFQSDPSFSSGIYDQIVYAPNVSSAHVRAADADFVQFMEEIYGWMKDGHYFERRALENGWYEYQGDEQTGWWSISYIDFYYSYDSGSRFLDEDDDPNDPNNIPAFCWDYPLYCTFADGIWLVYGTFLANIEVIIDYSSYHPDALSFRTAAGDAIHDAVAELTTDSAAAQQILEAKMQAAIGTTVAAVLADAMPWPELPPESQPVPQPRRLPTPLPEPANDPDFGKKWKWKYITRVGIVICGLLICASETDPLEDEWLEWYHIGWEWALQDLLEEGLDPDVQQIRAVIGEGEGPGQPYVRIPSAALEYGAIHFNLGVDENGNDVEFTSGQWSDETEQLLWAMNNGWIRSMMAIQSLFYDIGLYGPRSSRGAFYPCERKVLGAYPLREMRSFGGTAGWSVGPCKFQ